jgi:hypothetical protein
MADIRISELPQAGTLTGTELVPVVQNGQTVQTTTLAIAVEPVLTQTFLTFSQEASLANSRYLSAGTGIGLTNNGVQNPYQIFLNGTSGSLELASTGIIVKSGVNTITSRSIAVSGAGLTISNGSGVAGNPTIGLDGLPLSLTALSGNGIVCLNSSTTLAVRTLTGTASQIDIANGTGTANPTISISNNPVLSGLAGVTLPQGGTASRAGSAGTIRYNTDTLVFEGYANGAWEEFAVGGGVTSFSAGSTGLTPSSATTGAIVLGGTLLPASGGTGANTLTGYVYGNGTSAMTASATVPTSDLSGTVSNAQLANSAITINGSSVSLGGSVTVTATASNALTIDTGLSGTSYNGSSAVTIAISNTGVTANTYGSASSVPVFAVNAQGQLTSVTNTAISIASSAITDKGLANGLATLDAGGTVPLSQIPASIQGGVSYQGTWNATTNTPTLTSSVGTKGYYYVVSTAGSTNLNGITDWNIGDWAIFNGSVWEQIDNTDAVTSVNGFTGSVVLTTTNITEGTNEYFTTARARTSISAGTGISYDNSTGVVTNSAPDQTVSLTGAGTTSISGTYPNFTITSNDEFDGDVVGPASATDNAVARYDSTTGKLIQNSTVTINDNGTLEAVNGISFDTTPTSAPTAAGSLSWNSSDGTLDLVMKGGNVVQQIGEEQYYTVRNETGSTIANGTPVMANGVTSGSGRITVTPAIANGSIDELRFIGLTTESITNGINGYVTSFGYVRGLDTRGTPYGETWAEGDVIYVSPTTAGYLTNVEPTAPNLKIVVAIVITRNQTSGVLLVRPTAYPHITHLSDVNIASPTSGNLLIYDAPQNRWENADLTASTGISVTNGAGSVTITNTAPDQVVSLTGAGTTAVTGTYPNFTITSSPVVSVTADATNATRYLGFFSATTGDLGALVDSDLTYNPSTNTVTVGTLVATVGISGGTF